jgi:hypothetical protein
MSEATGCVLRIWGLVFCKLGVVPSNERSTNMVINNSYMLINRATREEIEKQVTEYIAQGGKVTKV